MSSGSQKTNIAKFYRTKASRRTDPAMRSTSMTDAEAAYFL